MTGKKAEKKTIIGVSNEVKRLLPPLEGGFKGLISPTHKRAEGRAPEWGSEFTSKDAALQGGSSRNRC
jgi:hypothetical protein